VIKLCAGEIFPGYRIHGAWAFRVTRNSDLYIDEEEAENLLKKIEEELRNQRRGSAVRLEIEDGVEDPIFNTLCEHLDLSHEYVFRLTGPLNLLRLMSLAEIARPDLKFAPFTPVNLSPLHQPERIFEVLRAQDVLLHHPYDSFQPVVDFVEQAARDPHVFALKQTLYRTSGDSPDRARADRCLPQRQAGHRPGGAEGPFRRGQQHPVGPPAGGSRGARGLRPGRAQDALQVFARRPPGECRHAALRPRRHGQLQSPHRPALHGRELSSPPGPEITTDIANLFNALTGFGRSPEFQQLLVAPFNLHARINELIQREAQAAEAGKPARIIAQMNSLVDKATIDSLYAASRAGVSIDLIVRGVCCLVPGVKGLSENIRVRSIVGRFLEHARAFYFENHAGEPLIYAGSSDWMPRNFFRRIEVVFPIADPALRRWIKDELFGMALQDTEQARVLGSDGGYLPPVVPAGTPSFSAQAYFIAAAQQRARAAGRRRTGVTAAAGPLAQGPTMTLAVTSVPLRTRRP
jgi:polyphosphate kinase